MYNHHGRKHGGSKRGTGEEAETISWLAGREGSLSFSTYSYDRPVAGQEVRQDSQSQRILRGYWEEERWSQGDASQLPSKQVM